MRRIIFIIILLLIVWLPSRPCLSYTYAYRHYSGQIEWAVYDVGILEESNIFFAGDDNLVIYRQDYEPFFPKDIVAVQINLLSDTVSEIMIDFGGADQIWETGGWDPAVFDGVGDYWHDYGPDLFSEVKILNDTESATIAIDGIIAFINGHADIVGVGPGNSANNKYNVYMNKLLTVGDLIEAGNDSGACGLLNSIKNKCDGSPSPPDFIDGNVDTMGTLMGMFDDLTSSLECE